MIIIKGDKIIQTQLKDYAKYLEFGFKPFTGVIMSSTYSIGCKDCKKCIWIGQMSMGHGRIYGNKDKEIFNFLLNHEGHDLIFGKDFTEIFNDYEEELL